MNIENLEVGMEFKNYKVLCAALDESVKEGNAKLYQIREWERFIEYSRSGHSFMIEKIYEEPISEAVSRGSHNKIRESLAESNPILASEWMTVMNGMALPSHITRRTKEEYWWKCSKCSNEIYSSPDRRFNNSKGHSDESITCPYCSLSKDAKKIYKFLNSYNVFFKQEWMFDDLRGVSNRMLRFDFAIFDKETLVGLIEYDGEFHDETLCPDPEKYRTISAHDKLKDNYCLKMDIPLLRIHHTEIDNHILMLCEFLKTVDVGDDINNLLNTIGRYEKEKRNLLLRIKDIENKMENIQSGINRTSHKIEGSFSMEKFNDFKEEN